MVEQVTRDIIYYYDRWTKLFRSTSKSNLRTYNNIQKMVTSQVDDYATGCLLDYPYFKNYYKMIAIDLSKQEELDYDPKAIQQINFNGNLNREGNTTVFFIIEEGKETVLDFLQETMKVL